MRCFIALDLPAAAREEIGRAFAPLAATLPSLAWVGPENYHVTLAFLGELPPEGVAAARRALASLEGFPAFGLEARESGRLPARGPWRVLVLEAGAGGQEAGEAAAILAGALDREAREAGLPPFGTGEGGRPFRAHLTLARLRAAPGLPGRRRPPLLDPGLLAAAEEGLAAAMPPGGWPIRACSLYKSELRPGGAAYGALASARFSPARAGRK